MGEIHYISNKWYDVDVYIYKYMYIGFIQAKILILWVGGHSHRNLIEILNANA
jgi:hypothetical protein